MSRSTRFDEDRLTTVLSEFASTLTGHYDVSEVLYRLAENVVEILGVRGAGVSVVDDDGKLRPVTGINELTTALEIVEEQFQEGPCVDAFRQGQVVAVENIAQEMERWPKFATEAARQNVQGVLGLPLRVREQSIGAMNVYSAEPRAWHDTEIRVARTLTDMAAGYVANASELEQSHRTSQQLREALDSRIVIEQAKGMICIDQQCSLDEAFSILRAHSRQHNVSLRAVAQAVVQLGLRPQRPRGKR